MEKNIKAMGRKGSVLVLVLWALGLLSVFAVYLGLGAREKIDFLNRLETRSKIFYIADAGIKQAVSGIGNLDKKKTYIALNDISSMVNKIFSPGQFEDMVLLLGYECKGDDFCLGDQDKQCVMYGVCDLQSKLNINTAERKQMIALLVGSAGIDADHADEIASSIIDWRDNDSMSLAKGAEDDYYHGIGYECKDNLFDSIEELRYVRGMDYNIFKNIAPYITVYGSGLVNINTAPSKVLKALGLSDSLTKKIIAYRCGQNGVAADGDDKVFDSTSSIVARLSQAEAFSASEVAELSNLAASGMLTVFSSDFLIQSQANLKNKNQVCRIKCVFEKDLGENSKKAGYILGWRLDYLKTAGAKQVEGDYEVWKK